MSRTTGSAGASARRHWMMAGRVLAASVGGYAFSSLCAAVLALLLPRCTALSPAASVVTATLLSFVIYTAVAIGVFGVRSALRAWLWLTGSTLGLSAVYFAYTPAWALLPP